MCIRDRGWVVGYDQKGTSSGDPLDKDLWAKLAQVSKKWESEERPHQKRLALEAMRLVVMKTKWYTQYLGKVQNLVALRQVLRCLAQAGPKGPPASKASYASEAIDEPRNGEEPVPEATH